MSSAQSSHVAEARRRWPNAVWIIGNGRYASVAHCGETSVMLFRTRAAAERAKASIDRRACGYGCSAEQHEIIDLLEKDQ